jgi:hypothetical protein
MTGRPHSCSYGWFSWSSSARLAILLSVPLHLHDTSRSFFRVQRLEDRSPSLGAKSRVGADGRLQNHGSSILCRKFQVCIAVCVAIQLAVWTALAPERPNARARCPICRLGNEVEPNVRRRMLEQACQIK